jgi:hypothetical protein
MTMQEVQLACQRQEVDENVLLYKSVVIVLLSYWMSMGNSDARKGGYIYILEFSVHSADSGVRRILMDDISPSSWRRHQLPGTQPSLVSAS